MQLAHRQGEAAGPQRPATACDCVQIAGAAAAQGLPLAEVKAAASRANDAIASMGAALAACTLPGAAPPAEARIQPGQLELGLGIHGEPGAERCELHSASDTVAALLQRIVAAERGGKGRGYQRSDRVALLVNNLGSTSMLEMGIVAQCALQQLAGARTLWPVAGHKSCHRMHHIMQPTNETLGIIASPSTSHLHV